MISRIYACLVCFFYSYAVLNSINLCRFSGFALMNTIMSSSVMEARDLSRIPYFWYRLGNLNTQYWLYGYYLSSLVIIFTNWDATGLCIWSRGSIMVFPINNSLSSGLRCTKIDFVTAAFKNRFIPSTQLEPPLGSLYPRSISLIEQRSVHVKHCWNLSSIKVRILRF